MRLLLITMACLLCAACRFEHAISAPPLPSNDSLGGVWEADGRAGRTVMRSMGDGRIRMLVEAADSGLVFDAHVVTVGKRRILQGNLMGRVGDKDSTRSSPVGGWMIWVIEQQGGGLTVRALRPLRTLTGLKSPADFDAAVLKALDRDDSLEPPVVWRRTGSDKPSGLKRSGL